MFDQEAASGFSASQCSGISHWAQQGQVWPNEFFRGQNRRGQDASSACHEEIINGFSAPQTV